MRSRSDGKSTEETKRGGPIGLLFAKISCCGGMLLVLVGAQLWSAVENWFEDAVNRASAVNVFGPLSDMISRLQQIRPRTFHNVVKKIA